MLTTNNTRRIALVTGAGSGIGREIAQVLTTDGTAVVLAGRRETELQATASLISAEGGEALVVPTDVTDEESVAHLVKMALSRFGRIDVAVNAAGIVRSGALDEMSVDDFDTTFSVNTRGLWLSMKHELAAMKPAGWGVIVNIGSNIGSRLARPGLGAYAASKAAVSLLTRTAALEAIAHGVRINAVCPGPIDTPLSYRQGEDRQARDERIAALNPSKRVGVPAEVAATVQWLCSDGAAYVVGQDIVVDGGASA